MCYAICRAPVRAAGPLPGGRKAVGDGEVEGAQAQVLHSKPRLNLISYSPKHLSITVISDEERALVLLICFIFHLISFSKYIFTILTKKGAAHAQLHNARFQYLFLQLLSPDCQEILYTAADSCLQILTAALSCRQIF